MCFDNSFASHPKAKYLSKKNDKTARQVFKSCNKKYIFDCKCNHSSKISLDSIVRGRWCSFCSDPPQKLCNDENCISCFKNSFASHPMAKHWSNKNPKTQREVFKNANKKYVFTCPYCKHEYIAMLCDIATGTWCNCLKNKTESKLLDFLSSNYNCDILKQKQFQWCKYTKMLPFDFCINKYRILIELDGRQHFEQVSNWGRPDEIHKRDIYKMRCANEKGYSVIRICQRDVWKDKNNWETKLKNAIKIYIHSTNIYIGDIYTSSAFYYDLNI